MMKLNIMKIIYDKNQVTNMTSQIFRFQTTLEPLPLAILIATLSAFEAKGGTWCLLIYLLRYLGQESKKAPLRV